MSQLRPGGEGAVAGVELRRKWLRKACACAFASAYNKLATAQPESGQRCCSRFGSEMAAAPNIGWWQYYSLAGQCETQSCLQALQSCATQELRMSACQSSAVARA